MTTCRIDHEVKSQIERLNRLIREAMNGFEEGEEGDPFEFKHYGPLYPKTLQYYRRRGYILEWKLGANDSEPSYWSFTVPELDINLENLR